MIVTYDSNLHGRSRVAHPARRARHSHIERRCESACEGLWSLSGIWSSLCGRRGLAVRPSNLWCTFCLGGGLSRTGKARLMMMMMMMCCAGLRRRVSESVENGLAEIEGDVLRETPRRALTRNLRGPSSLSHRSRVTPEDRDLRRWLFHRGWFRNTIACLKQRGKQHTVVTRTQPARTCCLKQPPLKPPPTQVPRRDPAGLVLAFVSPGRGSAARAFPTDGIGTPDPNPIQSRYSAPFNSIHY